MPLIDIDEAAVEVLTRTIADVRGRAPGPTLVVTGGLHGNEPAGARAAERIVHRLGELRGVLRGRIVLLRGNRAALLAGRRFIARDLNRGWTAEGVNGRLLTQRLTG